MNDEIPTHDSEALYNLTILYDADNDIHFFVEDTAGVHLHEVILKRILGDMAEINHVIPTGGKRELIDVYKRSLESNDKKCFFIADLDFDDVLGREVDDCNFVYLKRYCIENYLVDEKFGINFVSGRNKISHEYSKNMLKFNEWLSNIASEYRILILLFVTIKKRGLGIKSCDHSGQYFFNENPYKVNGKVVDKLKREILDEIKRRGEYGFIREMIYLDNYISANYEGDYWKLIPGKQLLDLYAKHLTNLTKIKQISIDDMKIFSANVCDLSELSFIRNNVKGLIERDFDEVV